MIKLTEQTDRLLEEIASAKRPTPELVHKIIPDRNAFVGYLKERGLEKNPAAKTILAVLDSNKGEQKAGARSGLLSHIPAPMMARLITRVMRLTRLGRREVQRVLPEIVTGRGQLKSGWEEILTSSFGLKVKHPVFALRKSKQAAKGKAAKKKQRAKARRRMR